VTPELRKVLLFFGTSIAVGGVGLVLAPRLLGIVAGPEADIVSQLAHTEREGLTLSIPGAGAPLTSKHHHFDRIVVQTDLHAGSAEAASTLDFSGRLGFTEVSSLGVEKTLLTYAGGWKPASGWAPRLAAVVSALDARRRAIEQGDVGTLASLARAEAGVASDPELARILTLEDRAYAAKAWYIRLDRDSASVTEEYRLSGKLPDRPVDEEGRKSLALQRDGGEFFFPKGLM
jgi:hypothetical protein